MIYRDSRIALRSIYSVANAQGGYFTAKQAAESGYVGGHMAYHIEAGNFERVSRGLFRINTIPINENDDLIRISLWSRGRDDRPQGVFSHVTALTLHGLSDVIPRKIHLTVPPSFRKPEPKGCVLHSVALQKNVIQNLGELWVTTPARTLLDLVKSNEVSTEQLEKSFQSAIARGLIKKAEIDKLVLAAPIFSNQVSGKRKGKNERL